MSALFSTLFYDDMTLMGDYLVDDLHKTFERLTTNHILFCDPFITSVANFHLMSLVMKTR